MSRNMPPECAANATKWPVSVSLQRRAPDARAIPLTRGILYVAHPGLNRMNLTELATLNQRLSLTVGFIIWDRISSVVLHAEKPSHGGIKTYIGV
jgi:hypothetical protein